MKNKTKNSTWIVYILECSDHSFYTGITNNLNARIKSHNEGKGAKYTRGRRPVKLMNHWSYPSKSMALKEEIRIKKLSRKQKFSLINTSDNRQI